MAWTRVEVASIELALLEVRIKEVARNYGRLHHVVEVR